MNYVPDGIHICIMCKKTVLPDIPFFEVNNRCVCDACAQENDFHRVMVTAGVEPNPNEVISADYVMENYSGEGNDEYVDMISSYPGELVG